MKSEIHLDTATSFQVQQWYAGQWKARLDCPDEATARSVRNHLNTTQGRGVDKFRAVRVTIETLSS